MRENRMRAFAARLRRARRRPVIGLAGFFGPGNFGDELFLEVFAQYLGPDFELRVLADLPAKPYYSRPIPEVVAEVDAIVIGGGDLLQPWQIDSRYFRREFLAKPCFIVGIGVPMYGPVPSTEEEIARRARILARQRHFFTSPALKRIGVRDDQARAWIEEQLSPHQPVLVAPDIVAALDLPPATRPEGPPILGLITRYRPNREVPDDYTRVAELARHAQGQGWHIRHIIAGIGEVGRRDRANADALDVAGKEIVYSESLDDLSRAIGECTALASMKFHGTVVATMYGVPSIVLVPTNKNRNFHHRLGLDALLTSFESSRLVEIFEARPTPDPEAVARIRDQAAEHLRELVAAIHAEIG